jgi:hypothetical protein
VHIPTLYSSKCHESIRSMGGGTSIMVASNMIFVEKSYVLWSMLSLSSAVEFVIRNVSLKNETLKS